MNDRRSFLRCVAACVPAVFLGQSAAGAVPASDHPDAEYTLSRAPAAERPEAEWMETDFASQVPGEPNIPCRILRVDRERLARHILIGCDRDVYGARERTIEAVTAAPCPSGMDQATFDRARDALLAVVRDACVPCEYTV